MRKTSFRFPVVRVSLAAFLVLLLASRSHAADPSPSERWRKGIERFENADKKNPPPPHAVLFIGSSSIVLWKTLAQDFPEAKVINRGFGGSRIVDSAYYADRIVIPYKPREELFVKDRLHCSAAGYRLWTSIVRPHLSVTGIATSGWKPQGFVLPKPAPPPTVHPFVPNGEKPFYEPFITIVPGTRHWVLWRDGDLRHYNTTQSVGDGSGMYVYLPAGAKSGWLTAYDTGVQPEEDKKGQIVRDVLRDYKGLCLWIQGDGSDAAAVFTTNSGYSKSKFRVPLKDAQWHKVFMPWEKWQEPITGHWWFLTYGLERSDDSKDNWYVVDRVHLYREEITEPIRPTPDNDPPGAIPASAFVDGREHVARTLAKLREKRPVKTVVAGDSLVTCAQLWYLRKDYTRPASDTYPYGYWWVLGQRLKAAYGYDGVACMLRTWDSAKKTWSDTVPKRPSADLEVFGVAAGGWTAKQGLEHLEQILNEKPDLVIWEYGANEGLNGRLDQYVKCTEEAVARLRGAGCEVVMQSMTTSADLLPKNWLNHDGHEMFTDVLEALLTDRDVRIWRHGPAAGRERRSL